MAEDFPPRLLESFETRQEAEAVRMLYVMFIVHLGLDGSVYVYVKYQPTTGWGVWIAPNAS